MARWTFGLVAGLAVVLSDLPLVWAFLVLFTVPWLVPLLASRTFGRTIFRSTVVVCDGCGHIRVAGGEDRDVRRLRAMRSGMELVYRPLVLSFFFLVAVNLYAWATDSAARSGSLLVTAGLAMTLFCLQTLREHLCPDPRPWWKLA
jgi:hypothetical protein